MSKALLLLHNLFLFLHPSKLHWSVDGGALNSRSHQICWLFSVNPRPVYLIALSPAAVGPTPRLNLISVKHLVPETRAALSHPCNTSSSGGRTNRPSPADFLVDLPSKRMASKRAVTAGGAFGLAPALHRWEPSAGQQRDRRTH